MERIICLIIGYAFGLIQTSYIIGKCKGIDIRDYGSGNAGTTNSMRVMGRKAGFAVVIIDIAKCIAAVIVTWLIFKGSDITRAQTGLGLSYMERPPKKQKHKQETDDQDPGPSQEENK